MNSLKKFKNLFKKFLTEVSYYTGKYLVKPDNLSLSVTFRCNFHCQMCHSYKQSLAELSSIQWLKTITDAQKNLPKDIFVEISGGEPLLRKDLLLKIIPALKQHFTSVTLNTNGSLINKIVVDELEKSGLDTIKISLYSLSEKIHNQIRGSNIAFQKARQAIELISSSKIKIEIAVLITSKNIRGLIKLIEHFSGYQNLKIILQVLDEPLYSPDVNNLEKVNLIQDLWPKKIDVIDFFNALKKNEKITRIIKNATAHLQEIKNYYLNPQKSLGLRCAVGQRNLIIFANGNLKICYKSPPLGNLTQTSMRQILTSDRATKIRLFTKHCKKYCRVLGCNYHRGFWEILRKK